MGLLREDAQVGQVVNVVHQVLDLILEVAHARVQLLEAVLIAVYECYWLWR